MTDYKWQIKGGLTCGARVSRAAVSRFVICHLSFVIGVSMIPLRMEVVIPLAKNGRPLFKQVYLGLRQGILSGTFPAGERLPSTRELADQLGVSRTVVLLAFDQLLAEGYAEGRAGSGTYVSGSLRLN